MKKQTYYSKCIFSCVMAICMILLTVFLVMKAKASDTFIIYEPLEYKADTYVQDGVKVPPTKTGYLFAGWFTSEDDGESYTSVSAPINGTTYYAKWVPAEVLSIKAQVTNNLYEDFSETDKVAIRFITTIDSTDYKHVGFNIQKGEGAEAKDVNTSKYVYKVIYAVDAEDATGTPSKYTPEVFHTDSEYLKTWTISNITATDTNLNKSVTVIPYWITLDGTRVEGATAVKTINMGRSWVYVDATDATTRELGTFDDPLKTIESAVGKTTPQDPTIILKSDITLTSKITVGKSLTLTSVNGATVTRGNSLTGNMFEISEGKYTVTIGAEGKGITIDGAAGASASDQRAIMVYKNATLKLNHSTIQNFFSNSGTGGSAVYASGGTVEFNDSLIQNCKSSRSGGSVYLGASAKMTMNSGRISGGSADGSSFGTKMGLGGNICCNSSTFTLAGGTIENGVADNGGNIYLQSGTVKLNGGTVKEGDAVVSGVTASNGVGCGGNIFMAAGTLNVGNATISNGEALDSRGGNIYMASSASMNLNSGGNITGGTAINGGSIFANGSNTITIDGTTISGGTSSDGGGNITLGSSGTLTMKSGIVKDGTAVNAGNIIINANATMIMQGGSIEGGEATNGGNIYCIGSIDVQGGEIKEGNATSNGGNIYGGGNSSVTLSNTGKVTAGTAVYCGGNIYTVGNLTLQGSSIVSNGTASGTNESAGQGLGGNIYLANYTSGSTTVVNTLTIENGTVENGRAGVHGGNIYLLSGSMMEMNDGAIEDGFAGKVGGTAGKGGNIYADGTIVTIHKGEITGGMCNHARGGNLYLAGGKCKLGSGKITITGGKQASIDAYGNITTGANSNMFFFAGKSNVDNNTYIDILSTLHADSRIGVKSSGTPAFASNATQSLEVYQQIFTSDESTKIISYNSSTKQLSLVTAATADYVANAALFTPVWSASRSVNSNMLNFEEKYATFFSPRQQTNVCCA